MTLKTRRQLYILWAGLFALCAALGFIPEPEGLVRALCFLCALGFFVPPAMLLFRGTGQDKVAVRLLSLLSLCLTVLLLLLNIRSALHGESLGNFLHALLVVLSAPMLASGFWAVSLFLWACLLIASFAKRR